MSRWFLAALTAGSLGLATDMAKSADYSAVVGCWKAGDRPEARVCFSTTGRGMFMLFWDEGRCGGNANVTEFSGDRLDWRVPRQSNACYQEGGPERLARRDYSCDVIADEMRCREVIYLDDGAVWADKPNVVFLYQ